jgi:membrane protease YdiL (CAAX protease family)
MAALLVLAASILLCALVVFFGPGAAERLLPLLGSSQQENYPAIETLFSFVIFGSLLVFALVGARISKVNPLRMGRKPALMLPIGALIGLIGVVASATYAWLAGTLTYGPGSSGNVGVLFWGTLVILFGAAVEEIYFRGWLQPILVQQFGVPIAVLLSALAFATLHVMGGARSPTTLVNLFLGGLLFGLLAVRAGGLAGAIAAHFTWNWSEQIVLGLDPNPGVGSFGAWLDLDLAGSALWGGSDEGLNASLAMTLTLFALVVPLLILSSTAPRRTRRTAAKTRSAGTVKA